MYIYIYKHTLIHDRAGDWEVVQNKVPKIDQSTLMPAKWPGRCHAHTVCKRMHACGCFFCIATMLLMPAHYVLSDTCPYSMQNIYACDTFLCVATHARPL